MQAPETTPTETPLWYVLRDLKRPNSKSPAYIVLPQLGFETFTPMRWVLTDTRSGNKTRKHIPYIPSLLFAKSIKSRLDEVIRKTDTLQYRFVKGAPQNTPMVVPTYEMECFRLAVTQSESCEYYSPAEITPDMIGRKVMIMGGQLDGTTGHLLKMRGSKKKRLIVTLEGLVAATIEVEPDYIQFV